MKTIGLIGGMSWESTSQYYSLINQGVNRNLLGNHSAKCIIYSFDFQVIEDLQYKGEWFQLRNEIINAGKILKNAGCDFVVLCTNTMHKVVNGFEDEVGIPIIHIAEAVGEAVIRSKMRNIGLLGTIFTMEEDFYKDVLKNKYRLNVIIPNPEDRKTVNRIIYEELVKGIIKENQENHLMK